MGEKFAIAFDIAVIVILAVFAFAGMKRGFAKVVLGLVSTVVSFGLAMALSGPIADQIYKNNIEAPIEEQLDSATNKIFSEFNLGNIPNIDFDKVKIDRVGINEVNVDYAGTRKAVVDFSKTDLRETGITVEDLAKIGITDNVQLASADGKTAELSMDDVEKYGLGKLAVAQYIAVNLVKTPQMKGLNDIFESAGKYIPKISGSFSADTIGVSALRTVVLKMFDTKGALKDALMNQVVSPYCTLTIRTIVFAVIFFLVGLILRIVAAAAKLINKIPVLGKVNAFLGFVLGLIEGLFAVFVVCLVTRLIISLSGANSILFNQAAIDSTFLFKIFYNFDFLNFLT